MFDSVPLKAHFTAHELRPSKSFKPSNQPARNSAPMEYSTMYRSEFTPKRYCWPTGCRAHATYCNNPFLEALNAKTMNVELNA